MKRQVFVGLLVLCIVIAIVTIGYAAHGTSGALRIELNTNYTDAMTTYNEHHYYKFILSYPGVIRISFAHEYDDSYAARWNGKILDEEDNVMLQMFYTGQSTEEISGHIGLPAGTYYFMISSDQYYSDTKYTFKVEYTQSDTWESESNDHKHTAKSVLLNTEYSGAIQAYDDSDYYSFTLPAAGCVTLDFSHEFEDSRINLWYLTMTNEEGNKYYIESYSGDDVSIDTSRTFGLPKGTYYILVYPSSTYSTVDYKFKVNYTETEYYEKEFNDNMAFANPVLLNLDYSGSMDSSRDTDYYCFTLKESGFVNIKFSHEYVDSDNTLWNLTLINADEKEYDVNSYKGNSLKTDESCKVGLPEGSYYIKISSESFSTAQYTFSIVYYAIDSGEREFNDNPHDANHIDLNTKVSGSLANRSNRSDKDCYRIKTTEEGILEIEFNHTYVDDESLRWDIVVLNDEGDTIESFKFEKNNGMAEKQTTKQLLAGDYFIQISSGNLAALVDYELSVSFKAGNTEQTSNAEGKDELVNTEWICPDCGQTNNYNFCGKCGKRKPEKLVCKECGKEYDTDSGLAFCPFCGTKLELQ